MWVDANIFMVVKHQVGWTIETVCDFVWTLNKLSWMKITDSECSTIFLPFTQCWVTWDSCVNNFNIKNIKSLEEMFQYIVRVKIKWKRQSPKSNIFFYLPAKSIAAINNKVFIVDVLDFFRFIQLTCFRLNSWSWMFDSPTWLSIYRKISGGVFLCVDWFINTSSPQILIRGCALYIFKQFI